MQKAMTRAPCCLMWAKGHSGVRGNEKAGRVADRVANLRAYGGRVAGKVDKITPAGVRQDFPIHSKPKHLGWSRKAVKGLSYVVTDRGPLKRWLKVIGREESDMCVNVERYRMRCTSGDAAWWQTAEGGV